MQRKLSPRSTQGTPRFLHECKKGEEAALLAPRFEKKKKLALAMANTKA
jgi:hypothetical protein